MYSLRGLSFLLLLHSKGHGVFLWCVPMVCTFTYTEWRISSSISENKTLLKPKTRIPGKTIVLFLVSHLKEFGMTNTVLAPV